jgi:hypothetical protein
MSSGGGTGSGFGKDIASLRGNFVRGASSLLESVAGGTVQAVTSVGLATGINKRRLSIDGTPVVLRDKLNLSVRVRERTALNMYIYMYIYHMYILYTIPFHFFFLQSTRYVM